MDTNTLDLGNTVKIFGKNLPARGWSGTVIERGSRGGLTLRGSRGGVRNIVRNVHDGRLFLIDSTRTFEIARIA